MALVGSVNRNAKPDRLRAALRASAGATAGTWSTPRAAPIGDIPVYEHVTDIPAEITLAVVNVGTRLVAEVVEECGKHGVPYVLIFTAGFSEVGEAGAALEREVGEVARRYGIRVFGPNTNTNAFEVLPEPPTRRGGRIGLVTQSGHQGRPLVQGTEFGVAFSRWVPTGNELDLEAADFIEYFAYDDDTDVIAGYFEGFKDPAKLRRALEAANAQGKPVVALKMGSTEAGTRMASSHTGHLAGSDAVVDGLFAPVRRGPGARPRRAARDRRRSSPSCPPAPGRTVLSLLHLGRIGHAHGRGGRVQRRARARPGAEDPGRRCAR